jgi:hypothetical protein
MNKPTKLSIIRVLTKEGKWLTIREPGTPGEYIPIDQIVQAKVLEPKEIKE